MNQPTQTKNTYYCLSIERLNEIRKFGNFLMQFKQHFFNPEGKSYFCIPVQHFAAIYNIPDIPEHFRVACSLMYNNLLSLGYHTLLVTYPQTQTQEQQTINE